jgi:hypothetical protein
VLSTDASGCFCWRMPLPRDGNGELLACELVARRGADRSAPVVVPAGGAAVELRLQPADPSVAAAPKRPARNAGTLVVTIADPERAPFAAASLSLQGENGMPVQPAGKAGGAGGASVVTFRGIFAGRYSLCARDEQHALRVILTGLDVPGDGACADARLQRVVLGEGLRVRTVRVVDAQRVPIAGATVRGAGFSWQTDGAGAIRLAVHGDQQVAARFSAHGHRDLEVAALTDGLVVQLPEAATLRIRVTGLPDGVPRERLRVWVRHEVRERLEGPRGAVDADGVAEVPLPVAANYVLWLLVADDGPSGQQSSRGIAIRPEPVAIGADPPAVVEWQLDEATAARVREALAAGR